MYYVYELRGATVYSVQFTSEHTTRDVVPCPHNNSVLALLFEGEMALTGCKIQIPSVSSIPKIVIC